MSAELSQAQIKQLQKVMSLEPGLSAQGKIGKFLDSWLVVEVLVKKLIMYHKGLKEMPIHWRYNQVGPALKHFNMEYDENRIRPAFSSEKKKRGEKTARELRNAYIHTLSETDRVEIEDRNTELVVLLNYWIRKVSDES